MTRPKIIIIRETVAQSWAIDAGTFLLFAALIGLGVLLDSGAMQWAGFIVGMAIAVSWARRKETHCTIEQARVRLDEIEDGR